eukprot:m.41102 g.41102  ORF g.41102 m.41102 type:complete len:75 (+) comp12807_c0_seq1:27-251(+)
MATEEHEVLSDETIESYRVVELREECKKRGLPFAGKKVELIERLKSFFRPAGTWQLSSIVLDLGFADQFAFGAL